MQTSINHPTQCSDIGAWLPHIDLQRKQRLCFLDWPYKSATEIGVLQLSREVVPSRCGGYHVSELEKLWVTEPSE